MPHPVKPLHLNYNVGVLREVMPRHHLNPIDCFIDEEFIVILFAVYTYHVNSYAY